MINLPDFSAKAFRLTNGKPAGFWQKARQSKHRHYDLVPSCIACYNTIKLYINIFAWQATADAGNKSNFLLSRGNWSTICVRSDLVQDVWLYLYLWLHLFTTWSKRITMIHEHIKYIEIWHEIICNLFACCLMPVDAGSFESFKNRPKSFLSMAVLRARTDSLDQT